MPLHVDNERKIASAILDEFQGEQIVWLDYEDGTYITIFIDDVMQRVDTREERITVLTNLANHRCSIQEALCALEYLETCL